MFFGIGFLEKFKVYGIIFIVDSFDVGENLQDYMYVYWVYEVVFGYSFNGEMFGFKFILYILCYYLFGSGLLMMGVSSVYIFCKFLFGLDIFDI